MTPSSTLTSPLPFAFGARCLFIGPSFGLSPHRNAVAVLALGIDAPFQLTENPDDDASAWRYRTCRSALIPPNTLHHLASPSGHMAFLYVDALSIDYVRLRSYAKIRGRHADFNLTCESQFIDWCHRLRSDPRLAWREVKPQLEELLRVNAHRALDKRIVNAIQSIHELPGKSKSLDALAKHAGLSNSRFLHLFKQTTGVPLRRYRLWAAMNATVRSMLKGTSLTRACIDAGFASSSHFSAAYREMFGMEPSRLLSITRPAPG